MYNMGKGIAVRECSIWGRECRNAVHFNKSKREKVKVEKPINSLIPWIP
jgi:hypothetical protein